LHETTDKPIHFWYHLRIPAADNTLCRVYFVGTCAAGNTRRDSHSRACNTGARPAADNGGN
jgi:hypothetical protein